MDKLSDTARETLPEFQKFLVERKLVPEKRVPFFAYWVSRFLSFAKRRDLSAAEYQEALILEFLDGLQSDTRVLEWQSRQANEAIRLYYFHQRLSYRVALWRRRLPERSQNSNA